MPKFDRIVHFDERSRKYGVSALIEGPVVRRRRMWTPGPILNQGSEGACVGHGWVGEALASPVRVDFARATKMPANFPRDPQTLAFYVYREALKIDEFPGEADEGTSVLAGAKVMQNAGLITEYRWAFGVEQVIDTLITRGPLVLGIPWYSQMYSAPGGMVAVGGNVVGGHCLLASGYVPRHPTFGEAIMLTNSWGPGYGIGGQAWIAKGALAALLAEDGEACIPWHRSYARG